MLAYARKHLSDAALLSGFAARLANDRTNTAELLADIAEIDSRQLYLPAGYSSMYTYCVGRYHLAEDATFKRIHAARTARRFPDILPAIADGRLHMSAVIMLAPHLSAENADELLAEAAHKSKSEIERLLGVRFSRTVPPPPVRAFPVQLAAERVGGPVIQHAPGRVELADTQQSLAGGDLGAGSPTAERFALPAIGRRTYDKLRYAQELLSHAVPSGDVTEVIERALDALIGQHEKRKFAAASKPRTPRCSAANGRNVPAHVRREVWQRDGGQCTFVGTGGHRCEERRFLEYDHVEPVARGGRATVGGIRLRCRAHNQYEAERVFGTGFMQQKREAARRAAAEARDKLTATEARASDASAASTRDVLAGLRSLGFRVGEARRAAEHAAALHDATLEQRMRAALAFSCRKPSQ